MQGTDRMLFRFKSLHQLYEIICETSINNDLTQDNIYIVYIINEFHEGVCMTRRKAIVIHVAVVIVSYVTIGNIILCVESTDWR